MMTEIIVAIIGAFATIATVIITNGKNRKELLAEMQRSSEAADAKLEKHQAVTDTKLEELTREVREHNNFAHRVPVLEEQIKVANHRIADLEKVAK